MTNEEKKWIKNIKESETVQNALYELNEKESNFIYGLEDYYNLSELQHNWLKGIWDKI